VDVGADALAGARRRGEIALAARAGDWATVRAALDDERPSARAGALVALARGGLAGPRDVARALSDRDPAVRVTACELAALLPGADFRPLLDDADPAVVEAASFALGEVGDSRAVARLATVARAHPDPLCREAAVAALGAIGDEAGRAAVLAALGDVPAVRRRAAVALAAFEGPEVVAALRGCLADRDWQVRQAAAEVLSLSGEDRC